MPPAIPSDFDNMMSDAVSGLRSTVEIDVPPNPDLTDTQPAVHVRYKNVDYLFLPFAINDELTVELIGYVDGRERVRRVLTLPE